MADCTDPKNNQLSAAFPWSTGASAGKPGGLQVSTVSNPIDMNALAMAAGNYQALSQSLNQMIGLDVRWFRAVPQQRSKDVIFQTYTLHNVEDEPLCLKVVTDQGGFPDSKYDYDIGGMEYEIPLTIYIDKVYWEKIAGYGTAPQEKDIVYFAIPNKLFEVASSYLWRGFAEQETTWKCNLKKYLPSAERRIGPNLAETIDKYTVSSEELFGEETRADIAKLVDDKQMNQFNSTDKDKYKILDEYLKVKPYDLDIYGIIAAHSFYDLSNTKYYNAVTYPTGDTIHSNDDRCITAWCLSNPTSSQTYDVESILPYTSALNPDVNYQVKLKTRIKSFELGDVFVISRPGALNFYAEVLENDTGSLSFGVYIPEKVTTYLSSIKSGWNTAKNFKLTVQPAISILDGINDQGSGFKVDILADQYIRVIYGSQEYVSIMTNKLVEREWYGLVINIGNTWGQYNVYVYQRHPNDPVSKLQVKFYETMQFTPEETMINKYTINRSPAYLTNLRLYTATMEEEKQVSELLSYFVKDADQLLIGDNADLRFRGPYIGQQR